MSNKELIAEARQEESIQDKLGDGFSEGSEERAFYYEHRDRYKRLADALEAANRERDAALAAIERVRVAADTRKPVGLLAQDMIAALDGAPEPEWEYGAGLVSDPSDATSHVDRLSAGKAVAGWNESVRRMDRLGARNSGPAMIVRRRKAGPWLPVGGDDAAAS